jgi:hypothetical protein
MMNRQRYSKWTGAGEIWEMPRHSTSGGHDYLALSLYVAVTNSD